MPPKKLTANADDAVAAAAAAAASPATKKPKTTKRPAYPDAPLDRTRFPVVFNTILSFPVSWVPLLGTGRAMRQLLEPIIFLHIGIVAHSSKRDNYGDPLVVDPYKILDPQHYLPLNGTTKLVLFPYIRPVSGDKKVSLRPIQRLGSETKIVSNVVYGPNCGSFKELVLHFVPSDKWKHKSSVPPIASTNDADNAWNLLALTIINMMEPPHLQGSNSIPFRPGDDQAILAPRITLVDFPTDINGAVFPAVNKSELGPTATSREYLINSIINFAKNGEPDFIAAAERLPERLKFMTSDEYKATMTPAEYEIETNPFI